jgi:ATP-dependent DNA helicase PIF1
MTEEIENMVRHIRLCENELQSIEEDVNLLTLKLQRKFRPVSTIVIDEISMVSNTMLTYISRRLSEIKNSEFAFGGMNVLAVGDFFQLRPIKGFFAFTNKVLWHLFHTVFLKQNMRQ